VGYYHSITIASYWVRHYYWYWEAQADER